MVWEIFDQNLFREMQSKAKGEYLEHEGEVPLDIRRKKTMKRIHEWERFEANCYMLKELEREKGVKVTASAMPLGASLSPPEPPAPPPR